MIDARTRANDEQRRASDPRVSAFVSASAGSGKTKLLTDRLLRLMLGAGDLPPAGPQRIQCLTFTKAAAAEMAIRLQRVLGRWVTMTDAALDAELAGLEVTPTPAARAAARCLFARVLDLPGGMRIDTIHAFCQSLLRRFPLEANLSPHFQLMDDRDAAIARQDAREDMLAEAHAPARAAALELLAGLATLTEFGRLVTMLEQHPDRLAALAQMGPDLLTSALCRAQGVQIANRDALLREAATGMDERGLREAALVVQAKGSASVAENAGGILEFLSRTTEARCEDWADWRSLFMTKTGPSKAPKNLVNDKLDAMHSHLRAPFLAEQSRIEAFDSALRAVEVARMSAALVQLAAPVAEAYAARKDRTGQLDYADLIGRTQALLRDPGAAWVLFKLDGGLDHLLLDEVQDTAPAQWQIAGRLTEEFFAGFGQRDAHRTIFAVGDRKQSIYGFQGADPAGFATWNDILRQRVTQGGGTWRDVTLDVSFRSTQPVLALVDAVFDDADTAQGVAEAGSLHHIADRAGHAGEVEIWPLTPLPDSVPPPPWQVPDQNLRQVSAPARLAEALAQWIAQQIRDRIPLASQDRPLVAGDFLVLVRRRNSFQTALVGALKKRGVPVAGLDRMALIDQPAVADLLTLCDTLLLPQDELSLACVLTSPLGFLTDDGLMALAMPRQGTLWQALASSADPACRAAHRFLATLLDRVDFVSPHALLAEVLGPLGGRARLLARLGPEAAEPIDELLAAALRHAQTHPPSLQGFLHWLRSSSSEVKREAESHDGAGEGVVRVMTVHGAKGLQSPVVILPDTTGLPPEDQGVIWTDSADPSPLWAPLKDLRSDTIITLRAGLKQRQAEEQNRLLYVALTRAEDRLVICGWETKHPPADSCWYRQVARGFARLGSEETAFAAIPSPWPGNLHRLSSPQTVPPHPRRHGGDTAQPAPLPAWAGSAPHWQPTPPPAETRPAIRLAPSRPEGANLGLVPAAASPLLDRDAGGTRFRRGQLLHTLLQHLPDLEPELREEAAIHFLSRPGHGIDSPESLADEVMTVLDHPDLAPLFGPHGRAEVPLTGLVAGQVVGGLIDRVAILPNRIIIADYKTNRAPPPTVEATPVLYLRQMAAYRAVLQAIHPRHTIDCLLVWTVGAAVMPLPQRLLDTHAPDAQTDA